MQRLASFIIFCILISVSGCASKNDTNSQSAERAALLDEKTAIQDLAFNTECSDESECKYIAFGSKPCGGPWFYLVYNSEIESQIKTRVEAYNKKEDAFNKKYGIASDCSVVMPPEKVECKDGKCIPVYK